MRDLGRVLAYIGKYKLLILISVLSMSLLVVGELYIPTFTQEIIDVAIAEENTQIFVQYSLLMVLALVGIIVFGLVNNYTSTKVAMFATADLRETLFVKIQGLSFKNIDKFKTSRLITTATNDMSRIQQFFQMLFRIIVRAPFMLILGLIFAIQNAPELSSIFLWAMPILVITIVIIIAIAFPYFSKVQKMTDNINKVTLETANSPRTIKSFVTMDKENEKFQNANENFRRINTMANKIMGLAEPIINFIFNATFSAAIVLGVSYYQKGQLLNSLGFPATGQLIAFTTYAMMTLSGLLMFAMVLVFLSRASVSAKRIYEVLDEEVDLVNRPNAKTDVILDGDITFENVCFSYGQDDHNVLSNLSFTVKNGQTIGIIGSTGSGKSSLINLLPRIYDVTDGSININGLDIRDIDLDTLRSQIAVVTQKAVIFSGSVGTNIGQGRNTLDVSEFNEAANKAQAYEFVSQYDDFYNHKIEQGGNNLSGGQKQRISLARAFMRKPKILILDDSTSAVDAKSEELILESIASLKGEMTTLVISQKISTIKDMDKILVLNNKGEIDGFDSHANLMSTSKVYQEIAQSQLGTGGGQDE
jgi:ATP-binding cassette subfamily B protein